jgi:hypothetical protein
MILDKANETVTAYERVEVDDGYGGTKPAKGNPFTFKAFAFPVGFAGAGWAINSKIEGQGWADVARYRLVFKPVPNVHKWSHVVFQNREWSIVEDPRFSRGFRTAQDHMSVTVELRGDV